MAQDMMLLTQGFELHVASCMYSAVLILSLTDVKSA